MGWTLLLETEGRRGSENMAVDHSLLRAAQEGVAFLRLYRWSPACLSFGRNETARTRYDAAAIRRLGLDTVRRPTGGRAVWHDSELTYAVAAPCTVFGTLAETYITIHRMLADALRRLGVPVALAPRRSRTPRLAAGACFATAVGGELVVRNAKLVGSAQVREGAAFLQHGSVLLQNDQDVVTDVTCGPRTSAKAISLTEALGRKTPIPFDPVAIAIAEAARRAWAGCWTEGVPPIVTDVWRYGDDAWTWRA